MINLTTLVSSTARTHDRRLFVDKSLRTLLISLVCSLLLTACTGPTVLRQQVLQPAQAAAMSKAKRLAILRFKNDRDGLFVDFMGSKLANIQVNGESYFTLLARDKLDAIIKEQRLVNESGLVKQSDAVKLGRLSGADTLISGSVKRPRYETTNFRENRRRCVQMKKDEEGNDTRVCARWQEYSVLCTKQTSYDEFTFKATDVTRGEIIFTKNYKAQVNNAYCSDKGSQHNKTDMEIQARNRTVARLQLDVAPYYASVRIELMNKDKSKMPKSAKELLKRGLKFAGAGQLNRGCEDFREAVSLFEQSPALYHNVGVCVEVAGDLDRSLTFFNKANRLSTRPEKLISQALQRVADRIRKKKEVEKQLQR